MIYEKIASYIDESLEKCTRFNPEDEGTLIGLPYPYSVPCASDMFQELYYWDTYFTNKGLVVRGDLEQARNNVNNMIYLIEKYGFMLNGSRTTYLFNSQPPFLSIMVRDIYEVDQDKEWLKKAYAALKKEHAFWMTNRKSENGLNRYDCMPLTEERIKVGSSMLIRRLGFRPEGTDGELARSLFSGGESGWDMNPRMTYETYRHTPADLNSLLFAMEENLAYFAAELGEDADIEGWKKCRDERATLCRTYLKGDDGLFYDYQVEKKERSKVKSVACFYPLFCGMATQEEAEAARNMLPALETAYGISTCEKNDVKGNYQWDYPNGWAPMQLIVVDGLLKYGYREDALRIAEKFLNTIVRGYEKTGHFWEKYNIEDGSTEAVDEYDMPTMMGWTFGIYTVFSKLLGRS